MQIWDQVSKSFRIVKMVACGTKPRFGQAFFSLLLTFGFSSSKRCTDAQMNLFHWGRIIIDEADPCYSAWAGDFDFLVELAPYGPLVGIHAFAPLCVFFGHMPAHAQRPQPMETSLALCFSTRIAKYVPAQRKTTYGMICL